MLALHTSDRSDAYTDHTDHFQRPASSCTVVDGADLQDLDDLCVFPQYAVVYTVCKHIVL